MLGKVPPAPPLPAMQQLPPPATPPDLYTARVPAPPEALQTGGGGFRLPQLTAPPCFAIVGSRDFITLPPYADVQSIAKQFAAAPPPPPLDPAPPRRRHWQQPDKAPSPGPPELSAVVAATRGDADAIRAGGFYRRGTVEPLARLPLDAIVPQEEWARLAVRKAEGFDWGRLMLHCQAGAAEVVTLLVPYLVRAEVPRREKISDFEASGRELVRFVAEPLDCIVAQSLAHRRQIEAAEAGSRATGGRSLAAAAAAVMVGCSEPLARREVEELRHAVLLGIGVRHHNARNTLALCLREMARRVAAAAEELSGHERLVRGIVEAAVGDTASGLLLRWRLLGVEHTEEGHRGEPRSAEEAAWHQLLDEAAGGRANAELSEEEKRVRATAERESDETWLSLMLSQELVHRSAVAARVRVERRGLLRVARSELRLIAVLRLQRAARVLGAKLEAANRRTSVSDFLFHRAAADDAACAAHAAGSADGADPAGVEELSREAAQREEELWRWVLRRQGKDSHRAAALRRTRTLRWVQSVVYEEQLYRRRAGDERLWFCLPLAIEHRERTRRDDSQFSALHALELMARQLQVEWLSLRALWDATGGEHALFAGMKSPSGMAAEASGRHVIEALENSERQRLRVWLRGALVAVSFDAASDTSSGGSWQDFGSIGLGVRGAAQLGGADTLLRPGGDSGLYSDQQMRAATALQKLVRLEKAGEPKRRLGVAVQERLGSLVVLEQPRAATGILQPERGAWMSIVAAAAEQRPHAMFAAAARWAKGAVYLREVGACELREQQLRRAAEARERAAVRSALADAAEACAGALFAEQFAEAAALRERAAALPGIIDALRRRDFLTPHAVRIQTQYRCHVARARLARRRAQRQRVWDRRDRLQEQTDAVRKLQRWLRQIGAIDAALAEMGAEHC